MPCNSLLPHMGGVLCPDSTLCCQGTTNNIAPPLGNYFMPNLNRRQQILAALSVIYAIILGLVP